MTNPMGEENKTSQQNEVDGIFFNIYECQKPNKYIQNAAENENKRLVNSEMDD